MCMLDNWGYKHTLRICNTYCFPTATMVARTRLSVKLQYIVCLVSSINTVGLLALQERLLCGVSEWVSERMSVCERPSRPVS
jgi:hypothetical protein